MNLSNRQTQKIQEKNIKDHIWRYIFLAFLVIICCLNCYEYSRLTNRPQIIRKDLETWIVGKSINDSIWFYKAKIERISKLMQELKELIESQRQLYSKIKGISVYDLRADDQASQIVSYQNKLGSFQQLQTQIQAEYKEVILQQHVIQLKQNTIISKGDKYNAFQKQIMDSISRTNSLSDQLLNIITQNREWKSKIQLSYKQKEKSTHKPQQFVFDLFDIQAYQTLPYLAKEVLDYDNILKLAKLLYFAQKSRNQANQFDSRQKKVRQRVQLANQRPKLESFSLMRYNLQSATDFPRWEDDILNNYQRLNKKYQLDGILQQKKICILVPTYNNNKNFRVEANLNSIFSQNYTNYKVVIIDDASIDNTAERIQSYLSFYKIGKDKCILKKNAVNKKALQNLYLAGLNDCSDTEVIVIVDGDDELIGFNTLKVINSAYTRQKLGVVYSSFYYYNPINYYVTAGFTSQYLPEEKKALRKSPQRFSHLITFKSELLASINAKDLKEDDGSFYNVAYDFAMIYPMMQLSCGRVRKIDQFQYLYSIGTGSNDYQLFEQKQKDIGNRILNKEQYSCLDSYKES